MIDDDDVAALRKERDRAITLLRAVIDAFSYPSPTYKRSARAKARDEAVAFLADWEIRMPNPVITRLAEVDRA